MSVDTAQENAFHLRDLWKVIHKRKWVILTFFGVLVTVGATVEFDEPYQGFCSGRVVELLRGVLGPVASVEIEPGRSVSTLCRRLHVMN